MPSSITITKVIKETARVRVRFSDGSEREYTNPQQIIDGANFIDSDLENLKTMYVALWYKRNPALTPSAVEGHSLSFDLSANPPLNFV